MGFLIVIAALVFVSAMMRNNAPTGYTGKQEKTWCPPHKWKYDDYGKLKCQLCNNYTEQVIR